MADNLALNDRHIELVENYLRFAKFHRGRHLRALEQSFEDVKLSRLSEETLTAEEVKELLDEICQVVKGDVELEMMSIAHTATLLFCQMCSQAQQWHLTLHADISELENRDMLEKVNEFEQRLTSSNSLDKSLMGSPLRLTKLEPLAENAGPNKLLQLEIERLKEENKKLSERLKDVENQAFQILEKKSMLSENLVQVQQELTEWKQNKAENVEKDLKQIEYEMLQVKKDLEISMCESAFTRQNLESNLAESKQQLLEVQSQLQLAEKELEMKLNQTGAFKNMKQMLATKNDQIRALRDQLSKYEPDRDDD